MVENKHIKLSKNVTYREQYYNGGKLWYKGFFVARVRHGYYEYKCLLLDTIDRYYYAK